jgi:hypothetical protein
MAFADPKDAVAALRPGGCPSLVEVVEAVRALPYRRNAERTADGVLAERCGTCSTKHALLHRLIAARWPELSPVIVHRVYAIDREHARSRFGDAAADAVPAGGLIDVHRYLVVQFDGHPVTIDATFPAGPPWDGRSSMSLACGPGDDHPVTTGDADAEKRALELAHCNPAVREPFIAALARAGR